MSWTLRYARSAADALAKLDPGVRRRIRKAIETLVQDPFRGKPLQWSFKGLRSWRTGDFRIIYRIREIEIEIIVLAMGHRRLVYDRLKDLIR